jgi:hypothetical protein
MPIWLCRDRSFSSSISSLFFGLWQIVAVNVTVELFTSRPFS